MHAMWNFPFMGRSDQRTPPRGRPLGRRHRGPGFWADLFGEAPTRAERGDVPWLVLDAIADEPRHGYDIIQTLEKKSGGAYRPSPGVIYPTLQLLEEQRFARSADDDGRRVFTITAEGKRELEAHREMVEAFYERSDDGGDQGEDIVELARRMGRLVKVFRRAGRRGHVQPATLKKVHAILDEAFGKIEALLESR